MTQTSPQPLNPLDFPLSGLRLIEASAGTGKTYTIAALYLRLVLGHGGTDTTGTQPLLPPQILVVTFTNAATRELRDRIRTRLAGAARVFRTNTPPEDDAFLSALLATADFSDESQRLIAARKLEQAAEWMDEAAIYTIHSWCQRMLTQHAFDTGSLFRQTLEEDDSELLKDTVRDYWRTFYYPLPAATAEVLGATASTPEKLLDSIRPLLGNPDSAVQVDGKTLADSLSPLEFARRYARWQPEKTALEDRARQLWQRHRPDIETLLREAVRAKDLNNASYKPATLDDKLSAVALWSEGHVAPDKELAMFAARALAGKTSKKGTTPNHPAFDALQEYLDFLDTRPPVYPVLLHAAQWTDQRFIRARQHRAEMGFNDMLRRLDTALASEGGEHLAGVIREQYPVAMIDEFQDTDPTQYRIFDRIYGGNLAAASDHSSQQATALLMIGDPKQAIYGFRGADIHTYLAAREATAGHHYTLERNFRSSQPLVDAVNQLFARAERENPEGALLFRNGETNPLPFMPVSAHGRKEYFEVGGDRQTAMTAWLAAGGDDSGVNIGDYRGQMAASCATEIVRLLGLASLGKAGFRDNQGGFRPVTPGDIAILVRSGSEAQLIRDQLHQRRVDSVYLSDRESVYDSREARDLWLWLRACAEPEQGSRIHAALASATLDLTYAELDQIRSDEQCWEDYVSLFQALRRCWQQQGILPMLRQFIDRFALPARLLSESGGERSLTNILHLAELMQNASAHLDGELAVLRYLQEQIGDSGNRGEDQVLRLESDADLVQVITIHKAKGLEYPLVFVPFICAYREVTGGHYRYQRAGAGSVVELAKDFSAAKQAADRERLQEDMRLLYVALTRPVHSCWLGLGAIKKYRTPSLHKSAVGRLLGCGPGTDTPTLRNRLAELEKDSVFRVDSPPEPGLDNLPATQPLTQLSEAQTCSQPVVREHWWIASYSAISRLDSNPEPTAQVAESAREEVALEASLAEPYQRTAVTSGVDHHQFPKGPTAGTFLHALLEWSGNQGFAAVATDQAKREQFLETKCRHREWSDWQPVLERWLPELLTAPLPLGNRPAALSELGSYQPEMEFWFGVEPGSTAALDDNISAAILPGESRPRLQPQWLGGMMKGFIDLVFEHQGRYWVADYKSNWLGAHSESYGRPAMTRAILDKRYDVQYAIYLLALHRHLKARLPGYADNPGQGYENRVGGALYWFLRGVDEPQHRGCFVDKPSTDLILALDAMLCEPALNIEGEPHA